VEILKWQTRRVLTAKKASGRARSTLLVLAGVVVALLLMAVLLFAVLSPVLPFLFLDFVSETTTRKVSPDGHWALVIDTRDEGALGGNTTVTLRPADGGDTRFVLHEGSWLDDRDVRWLDARTIRVDSRLEMPFVEHSFETGSPQTSGAELDLAGYVRNDVAPGERVALLSGLSFVLPDEISGQLLTRRAVSNDGGSQAWQELVPGTDGEDWPDDWRYAILSLREPGDSTLVGLAKTGRLLGRSRDVVARWQPKARSLVIITRLPGRLVGLVAEQDVELTDARAARERADQIWRELSVKGAELPWQGK